MLRVLPVSAAAASYVYGCYGHGVEEEQTTAHFLRGFLERRVVNMGITGGSPARAPPRLESAPEALVS